jgi:hypothetical protein
VSCDLCARSPGRPVHGLRRSLQPLCGVWTRTRRPERGSVRRAEPSGVSGAREPARGEARSRSEESHLERRESGCTVTVLGESERQR